MPESASSPNVTWPWSSNAAAYNRVAHAAGAGGVVCGLTSVGGDDQDTSAPDPGRGAGAAGGGHVPRVVVPRRPGEGKLDAAGRAASRRERKRGLTSASSSRWAGSITRATQDQYDLAAGALAAERAMLAAATGKLAQPVAAPAGGHTGKIAGYRSPGERHGKTRRLAQLTSRLAVSRPHWLRGARAWSRAANGCGGTGTTWRRH